MKLPSEDELKIRSMLEDIHDIDDLTNEAQKELVRRMTILMVAERLRVEKRWRTWVTEAAVRVRLDLDGGVSTSAIDELDLLIKRSDERSTS